MSKSAENVRAVNTSSDESGGAAGASEHAEQRVPTENAAEITVSGNWLTAAVENAMRKKAALLASLEQNDQVSGLGVETKAPEEARLGQHAVTKEEVAKVEDKGQSLGALLQGHSFDWTHDSTVASMKQGHDPSRDAADISGNKLTVPDARTIEQIEQANRVPHSMQA